MGRKAKPDAPPTEAEYREDLAEIAHQAALICCFARQVGCCSIHTVAALALALTAATRHAEIDLRSTLAMAEGFSLDDRLLQLVSDAPGISVTPVAPDAFAVAPADPTKLH